MHEECLLELHGAGKSFAGGEGKTVTVLEDIDLRIRPGEIVALVGRSGCGKSTLMRIVCGLTPASSGRVLYRGQAVQGPQAGISLVFQTFALFPWLDVLRNVELGLEALGVPREERRKRALAAIDMIGLGGFEPAYPKELSGGMRQRVGFARALVVNPDVLLMDEAFSALDVPTSETLRNDLLDLWLERQIPTRAILLVTHNIEEALLMADRVIVLDSNPGRIKGEVAVAFRHPRDRDSHAFRHAIDQVYDIMIAPSGTAPVPRAPGIGHRLPAAGIQQMLGVLESLNQPAAGGSIGLAGLADAMQMEIDNLFPLLEALELLGFARTAERRVALTPHGKGFVEADIQRRKVIFGRHLLERVPLAAHVRRVLDERASLRAPRSRFLRELEDSLTADEAERVLDVAIAWGRYAGIFAYDAPAARFSLDSADGGDEEAE